MIEITLSKSGCQMDSDACVLKRRRTRRTPHATRGLLAPRQRASVWIAVASAPLSHGRGFCDESLTLRARESGGERLIFTR